MPEMPDLEVFSRNLQSRLSGKVVASASYVKPKRLNVSPARLAEALKGQKIVSVAREGKETVFVFSGGKRLGVHLMLSGGFEIHESKEATRFSVLSIIFDDGTELVVFDPRGLTTVTLDPIYPNVPDATATNFEYLMLKRLESPKMLAKAFLIDQSIVRGIGNAYADEILWAARISPKSIMGKIPDSKISDLNQAIHDVLTNAVERISKLKPHALSGEERSFLAVHVTENQQSPTGHQIIVETVATKSTYFTDEQVEYS